MTIGELKRILEDHPDGNIVMIEIDGVVTAASSTRDSQLGIVLSDESD